VCVCVCVYVYVEQDGKSLTTPSFISGMLSRTLISDKSFLFKILHSLWSPSCNRIHQHFTSSFFSYHLLTKNYKPKLYVHKSWAKQFHIKTACKMLVKFTVVVNFTNIFEAAFELIFFCQKITNPNCKHMKTLKNTFNMKNCS